MVIDEIDIIFAKVHEENFGHIFDLTVFQIMNTDRYLVLAYREERERENIFLRLKTCSLLHAVVAVYLIDLNCVLAFLRE